MDDKPRLVDRHLEPRRRSDGPRMADEHRTPAAIVLFLFAVVLAVGAEFTESNAKDLAMTVGASCCLFLTICVVFDL